MSNIANPGNYLRTSRNFPPEIQPLTVEINKAYVDIATQVNNRTSGIYGPSMVITGESWFITGQADRQQTLRQVYPFTTTAPILHGINFATISAFTRTWGNFTDGTNWYGAIAASNVAIAGQLTFYVTPTQIIFLTGAGAPAVVSGQVILEWLSQI